MKILEYLKNNTDVEIDMNSREFTGLEYVQPIHLVFRFYSQKKTNIEDLVTEMVRRGACLNHKTSHGWSPLHYACRYSPNLIEGLLQRIPEKDKESYLNEPLHFQPSSQSLTLMEPQEEWYQTYLPLEIFMKHHSIHTMNVTAYHDIVSILTSFGAKNKPEIQTKEHYKKNPFIVEEPIIFQIGSSIGMGGNGNRSSNRKRIRHSLTSIRKSSRMDEHQLS